MGFSIIIPLSLVLIATIIGSFGSLYLKKGSKIKLGLRIEELKTWLNKNLFIGLGLYLFSSIFYLTALKLADLSMIYPTTSLSYVWTAFLSKKFLKEELNTKRWTGITLVVIGVALVSLKLG